MWASSWALSGFTFGPTNGVPFMCHWIEDEVSAKYDITHGLGLAIILPKYLDYCLNENSAPLYHELAVNVFDIDPATPAIEAGKICIEKLKTLFYDVCGLKPQFNDYFEMDESKFDEMAQIACRGDVIHGFVDLTTEDAKEILRRCL